MNRLELIRNHEKMSHEKVYTENELYQEGSWLARPVRTVMDALGEVGTEQTEILDLGCGVGRNSIAIAQYFKDKGIACNIDCVDLLDIALSKLTENAQKFEVEDCIKPILSSIDDFDITKKRYDFIIAVSAIEHIENKQKFQNVLADICKATKDDGIVCIIMNTEVSECRVDNREKLEPMFEVNIPTTEAQELAHRVFEDWEFMKETVVPQEWITPREDGDTQMSTRVATFVMRKNK